MQQKAALGPLPLFHYGITSTEVPILVRQCLAYAQKNAGLPRRMQVCLSGFLCLFNVTVGFPIIHINSYSFFQLLRIIYLSDILCQWVPQVKIYIDGRKTFPFIILNLLLFNFHVRLLVLIPTEKINRSSQFTSSIALIILYTSSIAPLICLFYKLNVYHLFNLSHPLFILQTHI